MPPAKKKAKKKAEPLTPFMQMRADMAVLAKKRAAAKKKG